MKNSLVLVLWLVAIVIAQAQDGTLDLTFDSGAGANGSVSKALVLRNNGKITIGGHFTTYNNNYANKIARLHQNGDFDPSFKIDPRVLPNYVRDILELDDEKLLIAGSFGGGVNIDNSPLNNILRINKNGDLDESFRYINGANSEVRTMALQEDGKIIIGGWFDNYNGKPLKGIARLLPDGNLDTTFQIGSGTDDFVLSVKIQKDGKILVGGNFSSFNGQPQNRLVRLNSDGSIDSEFTPEVWFNGTVNDILVQDDKRIVVVGAFNIVSNCGGVIIKNNIVRLLEDGSIDHSFDVGEGAAGGVFCVNQQKDGKILIGGVFYKYRNQYCRHFARINSDGSLDLTFNYEKTVSSSVFSITLQDDNKIILTGFFGAYGDFRGYEDPNFEVDYSTHITTNGILRLNNDLLNVEQFDYQYTQNTDIKIYPNPASNQIIVDFENLAKPGTFITISTISGKVIYNQKIENFQNAQIVDVNNWIDGIYILNISNGEKTINKKFIVQH